MNDTRTDGADTSAESGAQLGLQKVFLKDASFEAPNSPGIFSGEWAPVMTLNLVTRHRELGNDMMEVVLELSVEAKQKETTAFLVEVQQAGLFMMKGLTEEQTAQILGSYCPAQLYPYAREVVADLTGKGGFPQVHLKPVNFEALIDEARRREAEAGTTKESGTAGAPQA
jgi:preprotein translocase subunit SecB